MLTETEKAYLAGFFDGDGCVVINRIKCPGRRSASYCLVASLFQKNLGLLERWQRKVGFGSIYCNKANGMHQWHMSGQNAETFLQMLLPYLDLKHREAEIGLRFRKTQHGRIPQHAAPKHIIKLREQYRQMMKAAKNREGDDWKLSPELQEYEGLLDCQMELGI